MAVTIPAAAMTISQPRYHQPSAQTEDIVIRAREPGDIDAVADLLQLPQVRYGTLRLPYRSRDEVRRALEAPNEAITSLVATHGGEVIGSAALVRDKGRRNHVGSIAVVVHDDMQGRGVGSALLASLIETADRWLNLTRLELTVYADNERAIRLYQKFGFVEEGIRRADSFRDGVFVDSLAMARVRTPQED